MPDGQPMSKQPLSNEQAWTIARLAHDFFRIPTPEEVVQALAFDGDAPRVDPLSVWQFIKFLEFWGFDDPWHHALHIPSILRRMESVGMLIDWGVSAEPAPWDRKYMQGWATTRAQASTDLWLAPALEPEYLVSRVATRTVAITGQNAKGDESIGSGVAADSRHILTCAHVIDDLATVNDYVLWQSGAESRQYGIAETHCHENIDVALLVLDRPIPDVTGSVWRDPAWAESLVTTGFPPVPRLADIALVAHTGEVVNPDIRTYGSHAAELFLFSAVARPGNSGGPIVGLDGRFLGLVTSSLEEGLVTSAPGESLVESSPVENPVTEPSEGKRNTYSPYFAGVPTRTIARAIGDFSSEFSLRVEDWS